ncbi:hypothetical protein [Geomonas sp.]|uniref:hypothetical protein n=1 Tax=Geomonas sp. TaxID=2651584 RepID=UPI002B497E61|nr:hypothetical protein [Geomonas sp.]HJV36040.1 hypothetical protein [Geomonas sp.]
MRFSTEAMMSFNSTATRRLFSGLFLALCLVAGIQGGSTCAATASGFTGPEVPAVSGLRGDYTNIGARTADGRTDIAKLISVLKTINASDYFHLVWDNRPAYRYAWEDFQLMAPQFQNAGLNLWLTLTPPSEGVPVPFGGDYVQWAVECAKLAKSYPAIKGIVIDDFNGNTSLFTPAYCKKMMTEAHKIAPKLALLATCYYGYETKILKQVEQGAIDGVVFPYFYPQENNSDTTLLSAQIKMYRITLDKTLKRVKKHKQLPLIVMIYATKHSQSPDAPTPDYVKECIRIARQSIDQGLANGVVTYQLPKSDQAFIDAVSSAYR